MAIEIETSAQLQSAANGDQPSDPVLIATAEAPKPPIWQHLLAILIAIAMSAGSYFLFIQNNDFPYWYHPDEFKKGSYIMQEEQIRTFAHPALLLETGNLVKQWKGENYDLQGTVVMGRHASALLAAIGVFGFALAGYRMQGFAGLVLAGLATGLCPPLLVHAHYFKEDTALIAGLGICVLGLALVAGSSKNIIAQVCWAIILGIGCGMSMSGKYVGVIMILPSLIAIAIARNGRAWHLPIRLAVFLVFALTTIIGINFRAFIVDGNSFRLNPSIYQNIEYEIDHGMNGHYNIALDIPNTFAVRMATSDLMPHVWILGAIGLFWVVMRFKISRAGIAVAACLLGWIAVLGFNAIPIPRYSLPISVMIFFSSALLAGRLAVDLKNMQKWVGIAAIFVLSIVIGHYQFDRCRNFDEQFADDSRYKLRQWVAKNIPYGTMIPVDSYTGLQESGDPIRHPDQPDLSNVQIQGTMFAADLASTPEELANTGVEYVIVAWPGYMRFLDPQVHGWPSGSSSEINFNRRKKFYLELFAKGEIAYQLKPEPATHSYVNPEVTVYNIKKLATQPIRRQPNPEPRSPSILRMFGF